MIIGEFERYRAGECLPISRGTEEENYRARTPTVLSGRFLSRSEALERLNRVALSTHRRAHLGRSGLIALEASLRRVFFPNLVTAAAICSRACLCIRYIGLRAGARGSLFDF